MMDGEDLFSYEPPPSDPRVGGVRVAACPYCGAELRGTVSLALSPRGRLLVLPGDPPPPMDVKWRVVHVEPLCFEWKTERVDAGDLMDALNEGEDQERGPNDGPRT